jgi:DNA-binding MarR family transcriptional regulator
MSEDKLDKTAELFLSVIPLIKRVIVRNPQPDHDVVVLKSQYPVLLVLKNYGTLSMSDLCNHLCMSKPQMSVLVDKMIEEGKIIRIHSGKDRRVILISLSSMGKKFLAVARNKIQLMIKGNLADLNISDLNSLNAALIEIQNILSNKKSKLQ